MNIELHNTIDSKNEILCVYQIGVLENFILIVFWKVLMGTFILSQC